MCFFSPLRSLSLLSLACALQLAVCSPSVAIKTDPLPAALPQDAQKQGDSQVYTIELADASQRKRFVNDFKHLMESHPNDSVIVDTMGTQVRVEVVAGARRAERDGGMVPASGEPGVIVESTIEPQGGAQEAGALPARGGSVRLYSPRPFLDEPLCGLVAAGSHAGPKHSATHASNPWAALFGKGSDEKPQKSAQEGYLRITRLGSGSVEVVLGDSVVDGAARALSAFDVVSRWTSFIREQPAEGFALFRHVRGVLPFIRGQEAVVSGFIIKDQRTIVLVLEREDADVVARLDQSRLLGAAFKLGPYVIGHRAGGKVELGPNEQYRGQQPFLEQCILQLGGDKNPLLSYSLKKYDAVVLTTKDDISYARSRMGAGSRLTPYSHDRYFLSLAGADAQARAAIASVVDGDDILNNHVRAHGRVLGAVEREGVEGSPVVSAGVPSVALRQPLRIVFRQDDTVSVVIAHKLLAQLSGRSMGCELRGATANGYERALVERSYDVAVGWVSQRVVDEHSEQLRLAAMWFDGMADESERVGAYWEVPLFVVERLLLHRETIGFWQERFENIFVEPTNAQ